jgi:SPP1 family predicted phage head-tail adaptor
MRGGDLRHLVSIEAPDQTRAPSGAVVRGWKVFVLKWWARVEPVSGRESFTNLEFVKEITHQVTMRFVEGLTSDMRVTYGARHFDILAVANTNERNVEHVLLCREGQSKGN